jgi:hypothetical protein
MKYVVRVTIPGGDFWLRSTIWTSMEDRADNFTTSEAAKEALVKAKKFMRPAVFKAARIVEMV